MQIGIEKAVAGRDIKEERIRKREERKKDREERAEVQIAHSRRNIVSCEVDLQIRS